MKKNLNKDNLKQELEHNKTDRSFMKHASMLTEEQKNTVTTLISTYKGIAPRPHVVERNNRMVETLDKLTGTKIKDFNANAQSPMGEYRTSLL